MRTHRDIIDRWPSIADFARDLGVAYSTAQVMRWRCSIHPRHWSRVVEAAKARGIAGITAETLVETHGDREDRAPGRLTDAVA